MKFVITPGNTHYIQAAAELLAYIGKGQMELAHKAYDANRLRDYVSDPGDCTNIRPKSLRKSQICFSPWLYKQRDLVERFFNKLKYYRCIVTRYDQLGSVFASIVKLACFRITLRHYTFTPYKIHALIDND